MTDLLTFFYQNWDTISLLITNVIAFFVRSPLQKR